jgi:transcriptional regulator with AAA-type ATPase domain
MLAPDGTHIAIHQMFPSYRNSGPGEYSLDGKGGLSADQVEGAKSFCDAILSGVITMEQANTLLAKTAVEKAKGNLSAAARMLGLSRAQLAYRLEQNVENPGIKPVKRRANHQLDHSVAD